MSETLAGRLLNGQPWLINNTAVITGTEFAPDRIFQRVGTSKDVPVSGTYTGTAATVQAQVLRVSDDGIVVDWTNITGTASNGSFSGTVTVPQGGWYRLKLRGAGSIAAPWTATNQFGVGLLIAILGQSNNATFFSRFSSVFVNPSPITRRYAGNGWTIMNAGVETIPTPGNEAQGSGAGDPIILMGVQLATVMNMPIGMLEYAVDGSAISSWLPNSGQNWAAFATALSAPPYAVTSPACGGDFEAAVWLQGETDLGASKQVYQANLELVWAGLKTLTGRTDGSFKFGVTLLGPTTGDGGEVDCEIRQAHLQFISDHRSAGVFMSASFTDATGGDAYHPDFGSHVRLGRRYALSIAHEGGVGSYGADGPKVASASCASGSASVVVTIQHDHGTALLDGAGGNGTALAGFRVFRNGSTTAETISATAITNNTQVTLTLAAPRQPGDTMVLDYAMRSAPMTGSIIPDNTPWVYDNTVVPTTPPSGVYYFPTSGNTYVPPAWFDTLGLPLQPTLGTIVVA